MVIFCATGSEDNAGLVFILGGGDACCPICIGRLIGYGWRQRVMIESDGSTKILNIHRLQCANCNRIHHELPDILIPYKRHCAETIINIIDGNQNEDVICDDSTINRILVWWKALYVYFSGVINSLRAKFGAVFSSPARPKEIVRAVANANLWVSTRSAQTSG